MNHGRKQHDSHMGSKTLAGKQPHGLSKNGNKQRQVCKVNSHWALARHQPFPSQSGRLVVVQCGALTSGPSGLDLLGLVLGLLDLALSSLALGSLALGSWLLGLALLWLLGLGLVELVLEVVLVEHSGSGHHGHHGRKPGLATAVATAVAGGHSGCREEKHFNHLV